MLTPCAACGPRINLLPLSAYRGPQQPRRTAPLTAIRSGPRRPGSKATKPFHTRASVGTRSRSHPGSSTPQQSPLGLAAILDPQRPDHEVGDITPGPALADQLPVEPDAPAIRAQITV